MQRKRDWKNAFSISTQLHEAGKAERILFVYRHKFVNYGFYEHQGMKRRLEKKHVFNIKGQQAVMNFFIYDYQLSN